MLARPTFSQFHTLTVLTTDDRVGFGSATRFNPSHSGSMDKREPGETVRQATAGRATRNGRDQAGSRRSPGSAGRRLAGQWEKMAEAGNLLVD